MISQFLAPALAAFLLASPALIASVAARDWVVDPANSKLALTFQQGQTPVQAGFERFTAKIRFDPAALTDAMVEVQVDLASFTSGEAQRDSQAKGADFLAADAANTATYRATSFEHLDGDRYRVLADLTLKGVTKQVSHEAIITIDGDHARADGVVPITRTEFGVGTGQFATGSIVGLQVDVTFTIDATGE